jgi:phosphoserine phosphatase
MSKAEKPRYSVLLLDALADKKITQTVAASKMGIGRTTVCNTVNGRGCPKVFRNLHKVLDENVVESIVAAWEDSRRSKGDVDVTAVRNSEDRSRIKQSREKEIESEHWYCVVEPNQTTREYISIDDVQLTIRGDKAKAVFTRMFPRQHDRGRCWIGIGKADGDKDLRLLFKPIKNSHDSRGSLVYTRKHEERPRVTYYAGVETRGIDTDHGRIVDTRTSYLYSKEDLPSKYMPTFAALDLDNTLFDGWSIIEWAKSPPARDLKNIDDLYATLIGLHAAYTAKPQKITHDEFALGAGDAYKKFYEKNLRNDIRKSAVDFAEESVGRGRFHPFASEIIRVLRDMLIAPVLITGAPQELAQELAAAIGISEVYGFNPRQTSEAPQTGTATGKAAMVGRLITSSHRVLQFAAGDEQSDILMLRDAPVRAAATFLVQQIPEFSADPLTYEFTPRTSAEEFSAWMRASLPDHSLFPATS